jgi:hypothetical protein
MEELPVSGVIMLVAAGMNSTNVTGIRNCQNVVEITELLPFLWET